MIFKVAQVIVALCLTAGYALKLNDTSIALPDCVGKVLESSHADDWRCDNLGGTIGSDEKKCTERYEAGTDGKVHRQCTVHKASATLFNCLASTPCKVKEGYHNTCSCSNGVAAAGAACTKHNSVMCTSCSTGYDLTGGACILRTCTCKHGEAATGANCPTHGQEKCARCTVVGYELKNVDGKTICHHALGDIVAQLSTKASEERTAVAWGDPHVKVFDHAFKNKDDRLRNFGHNWANSNLNVMEPGTYWFVKAPGDMISIQGVYGWRWRAVVRSVAISGLFIKNDVIQIFPYRTSGPMKNVGLYYQYQGQSAKQLHKWNHKAWTWENDRKDVSIKWARNNEGLRKNNMWRCKITLPLFVELIFNVYSQHMDVVATMRPIEGMYGDFGNFNKNEADEMKWNPNIHQRNPYWYQMTTAHGTRVTQKDNLFPFWYDVPKAPNGAKTTALLQDSSAEKNEQDDKKSQDYTSMGSDADGDDDVVVDGVELQTHTVDSGHDCSTEEEAAAKKLCHEMFKVNNSVKECVVDVCQGGAQMAQKAQVVEVEVEDSEEDETVQHFKVHNGGQLYKSCFNADEHFTKLAAMPRNAGELHLIKEQAVQPTLLGAKCVGDKWVYVDSTEVPADIISSACSDGEFLCVQGQTVSACEGASKIACQIPRLYTCRAVVPSESIGTACPGGMQVATPVSAREKEAAQKAMDSDECTTKQAWSGVEGSCFEETKSGLQVCGPEAKTVMCETKFA